MSFFKKWSIVILCFGFICILSNSEQNGESEYQEEDDEFKSYGWIVLVVMGSLLVLLFLLTVAYMCYLYKNREIIIEKEKQKETDLAEQEKKKKEQEENKEEILEQEEKKENMEEISEQEEVKEEHKSSIISLRDTTTRIEQPKGDGDEDGVLKIEDAALNSVCMKSNVELQQIKVIPDVENVMSSKNKSVCESIEEEFSAELAIPNFLPPIPSPKKTEKKKQILQFNQEEEQIILEKFPKSQFHQIENKFNLMNCLVCDIYFNVNDDVVLLDCGHLFHDTCFKSFIAEKNKIDFSKKCSSCNAKIFS
jgi:hypothetical protein